MRQVRLASPRPRWRKASWAGARRDLLVSLAQQPLRLSQGARLVLQLLPPPAPRDTPRSEAAHPSHTLAQSLGRGSQVDARRPGQ